MSRQHRGMDLGEHSPVALPQFSLVRVELGDGGLLCGVVEGLRRNGRGSVPVLAVETEGVDSFAQAVRAGTPTSLPQGRFDRAHCLRWRRYDRRATHAMERGVDLKHQASSYAWKHDQAGMGAAGEILRPHGGRMRAPLRRHGPWFLLMGNGQPRLTRRESTSARSVAPHRRGRSVLPPDDS